MRRLVRPYFQGNWPMSRFYDVTTWTATRLVLDFGGLPFQFMWLYVNLRFWRCVLYKLMYDVDHTAMSSLSHTATTTTCQ